MPLIHGKSKKAFEHNVKAEMKAGKPQAQSLAISYSIQKKNKKKKMAYGGKAEATEEPAVPGRKPDDERPAKDAYMAGDFKSEPGSSPRKPDDKRLPKEEYTADHFADGGEAEGSSVSSVMKMLPMLAMLKDGGEISDEHHDSIADAILSKQHRKKMADGGQVDLDENAQEQPNNLDDMNYDALRKENYAEEHGLSALNQPEDSNEHGHVLSDEDEHDKASSFEKDIDHEQHDSIDPEDHDEHDMVESIRRKLKAKRG